jgi:hypothetical protein
MTEAMKALLITVFPKFAFAALMQFLLRCKPYPDIFDAFLNPLTHRLHVRLARIIAIWH